LLLYLTSEASYPFLFLFYRVAFNLCPRTAVATQLACARRIKISCYAIKIRRQLCFAKQAKFLLEKKIKIAIAKVKKYYNKTRETRLERAISYSQSKLLNLLGYSLFKLFFFPKKVKNRLNDCCVATGVFIFNLIFAPRPFLLLCFLFYRVAFNLCPRTAGCYARRRIKRYAKE